MNRAEDMAAWLAGELEAERDRAARSLDRSEALADLQTGAGREPHLTW
jgi:hypothetical protein